MDIRKTAEDYFGTWVEIITKPEEFFTRWDLEEGYEKVALFVVLSGLAAGLVNTVLTLFSGASAIIIFPLLLLFRTVVWGVMLFICFRFLGGKGEVESTLKMVGYTQAVGIFIMGIPKIGWLAVCYQAWLLVVGGKRVQGLDTTKSFAAVFIFFVCLLILMSIF